MPEPGRAPNRRAGGSVLKGVRPRLLLLALLGFLTFMAYRLGVGGGAATASRARARDAAEADAAPGTGPSSSVPEIAAQPDAPPSGPAGAAGAPPEPPPPGTVTGVVRLPDGRPPEDVVVVVTREGAPEERRELRPDADGQVWLDRLAPGRYRLRATHADYAPRVFAFDVSESLGAGPFDIVFAEGGTVLARVVDALEVPVKRRRLGIRLLDAGDPEVAYTDASGEARFERLPAGYYWIHCGEAGVGPRRDVRVEPGRTAEVLFDLSCGLIGTAFDASGAPLAKVGVRLQPVSRGPEDLLVLAETDDLGRFEILGVRPGEYRPRVAVFGPGGYYVALEPVELVKGERKRHDLRIPPRRISGRVRRATGEPFGDIGVTIQAFSAEVAGGQVTKRRGYCAGWLTPDGWSAEYLARPDAEGRFALLGIPPGQYEVWVIAAERPLAIDRRLVEVAEADALNVDFALPRGPVGKVRVRALEADGTPATGVLFSETLAEGVGVALDGWQVGDGLFELDLDVGPHELDVYRLGAWSERVEVEVSEGATVERVVKGR